MKPDVSYRTIVFSFVIFAFMNVISNKTFAVPDIPHLNLGGTGEGFGISRVGGHDHGTNSIGVWLSDSVRVAISDTFDRSDFSGVGIFDNRLTQDDLKEARNIHSQLCNAAQSGPVQEVRPIEPATTFYVDCASGSGLKTYSGKTYDLPETLCLQVDRFFLKVAELYLNDASVIVRLDARVERIERLKNMLGVTVKLINNGRFPIKIRKPDLWGSNPNYRLTVSASQVDGNNKLNLPLAGLPLDNGSMYRGEDTADGNPNQFFIINERDTASLKFLTVPGAKLPAGTYRFDVRVSANISARDVAPSMGYVDFHSDYKNPAKITVDRDYPSTPEEWKDYESRKAKEVAPVPPGASIVEPGMYRAVMGSVSSPFLAHLAAGAVAPAAPADVRFADWKWTADPGLAVAAKPGEPCPRTGRWMLCSQETYYPDRAPQAFHEHLHNFRAGEPLSVISVNGIPDDKLFWGWQG